MSIRMYGLAIDSDTSVRQASAVDWRDWAGERVRRLRKLKKWTQEQLGDHSELDKETINRFENGIGNPKLETAQKIAAAFEMTVDDLLARPITGEFSARADREVEDEVVDVSDYTKDDIPVIFEGEASPQGTLFWTDEGKLRSEVEQRISRPRDVTDPRAYGVKVRGDSMIPRYLQGETLIVSPNAVVRTGQFVYVELLTGERLIKRAHRQPDGWNLESLNPVYAPRFVRQDEIGVMHKIMYGKSL